MLGDVINMMCDALTPLAEYAREGRVRDKYPDIKTRPRRVSVGDLALTNEEVKQLYESGALALLVAAQKRQSEELLPAAAVALEVLLTCCEGR